MKNGEKFHFTELLPVFMYNCSVSFRSRSIVSINFYIFIPIALGLHPSGIGQ